MRYNNEMKNTQTSVIRLGFFSKFAEDIVKQGLAEETVARIENMMRKNYSSTLDLDQNQKPSPRI